MVNITLARFEKAVQRFEQAETSMIANWEKWLSCLAPGERPQCWNCPSYKGLGRLIQEKLHSNPAQTFAEILPPEYEDPTVMRFAGSVAKCMRTATQLKTFSA
jgi:hypothetical protein